ncbi:TonB-dependent receptor family protein [Panacagrimonas sp.]|uniref:TonB-dependent receptor family protein n=1 Tax=Panacagrimonas sp. TaxID=2480088 RepID=UPI003B52DE8C
MQTTKRSALMVAAGLCGVFDAVKAQESESAQAATEVAVSATTTVVVPPIRVESSLPDEVDDTPGAAHRLSAEDIETYRPYTLHDAFDFVPGVRHIDDDALGRRSGIGIRGAPSRRSRKTLLLEDGVPINASTYLDPSAHYTPPIERLESVDVLKGAGHILHGPLNNHGIVNFINKRPTATPETTIELGAGDLSTFKRHAMHTRTDGALGTVFAYSGLDADGTFDLEETKYDDFFVGADWKLAEHHRLGFSATYFRERSDYDESNLTPVEYFTDPRRKRGRFGQEFNQIAVDYQKYALTHDFQISDALSMSTQLFATDLDRPRFTVDPDEVDFDALPEFEFEDPARIFVPGVSGVMISRDRHYNTYGIESRMQLDGIEAFGAQQTLQWGLRFERHFLDNRESFGDIGEILDESNRGNFFGENELEEALLEKFQSSAVSGFVQSAMRYGRLTVTPGIRVEHYTQLKNLVFEGETFFHEQQDDDNTLVLPSISFLYDVDDRSSVFGNVARGYTPAFARTAAEFPLDPETGVNSQIGMRAVPNDWLRWEGAVFYNMIRDTVIQEPYTIDDRNVVVNAEDSVSYGIDLGLRIGRRPVNGLAPFAELAWNFTEAEFTDGEIDGNEVPEIADNVGSLSLGLDHSAGWHLSVTVSHLGSFYTDLLNTKELVVADEDKEPIEMGAGESIEIREPAVLGEVSSHTIYSARASYRFGSKPMTMLWVQGRNLSDKLYVSDHENGMRPGAERSVMAGVTVRF